MRRDNGSQRKRNEKIQMGEIHGFKSYIIKSSPNSLVFYCSLTFLDGSVDGTKHLMKDEI